MTRVLDGIQSQVEFVPTDIVQARSWQARRAMIALGVCITGIITLGFTLGADLAHAWTIRQLLPPGHYLVLLQNNSELRPGGGFIGTFAVVDLTSFGYQNLAIDTNIYKRDNAFTERQLVEPPAPLAPISNGRWAMRDANWAADFRDAAEQVAWFYKQEGGEAVDGVIAVNATVAQDLLALTGPVPLPGSTDQLSAETFFDTLHYKIEKEYFQDQANVRVNEPKTILKELVPIVLARLTNPLVATQVLPFTLRQLSEKHILLYHTDESIEAEILKRGWGGELPDGNGLAVVNANVGGQKSSLNVRQDVRVEIASAGDMDHVTVTLHRTHTGDGLWPDHTNDNYTRIFVPDEAELIAVIRNGVRSTDEVVTEAYRGRTSWGITINTPPGGTSELQVSYNVPATTGTDFVYRKQPGVLIEHLTVVRNGQMLVNDDVVADVYVRE